MIRAANPEIAGGDYTALKIPDSKMGGFIVSLDGSDVIVMRKGTVLRRGSSSELMASMSGRVWQIECGQSTALDLSEKYKTVYMNQLNGNIYQVRIISDECPAPEAINSEPELEDYYIDVFSEKDKKTVL